MSNLSSGKNSPMKLANTTTYQAGVVQSTMSRQIKKFTDKALKEYGITTMQWFVIGIIYDSGDQGVRISDLSRKVNTNVPYITNVVNLLESKGILIRGEHTTDNRAKIVKVNPDFAPTCVIIENSLRQKMRKGIYSHIEPAELQIYLNVIHELSSLN